MMNQYPNQTLQSLTKGPSFSNPTQGLSNASKSKQPQIKSQMDLKPIKEVLGDDMPAITPDPLGKYRLLTALKRKFGPSYRSHPSSVGAIHHFEKEYNYFKTLRHTLGTGGGNSNG